MASHKLSLKLFRQSFDNSRCRVFTQSTTIRPSSIGQEPRRNSWKIRVPHNQIRSICPVKWICVVALTGLITLSGCATLPYKCGSAERYITSPELVARTQTQIERGRPNVVIDSLGWVWGIGAKLTLFDRRVENHRIDAHTEAEIAAYLQDNQLSTVKVRLNQYRPLDDWGRLRANKSVGAGWRYTFGAISVLGEMIFPGRVFGKDHFNPFTNTIHLYSNVPALALHEAGHSKDYARRTWKGTYAAIYLLPFAPLSQEAIATNDALSYVAANRDLEAQQEAYEILYPAYGTYVGNAISGPVPQGYFIGLIGGHIAGRWKSWILAKNYESQFDSYQYGRQQEADADAASVADKATLRE